MSSHHFEYTSFPQGFSQNNAEVSAANPPFFEQGIPQNLYSEWDMSVSSNENTDEFIDLELDRLCREPSSKAFQKRHPEIHSVYSDFNNIDMGFDAFLGFDVSYFDI